MVDIFVYGRSMKTYASYMYIIGDNVNVYFIDKFDDIRQIIAVKVFR